MTDRVADGRGGARRNGRAGGAADARTEADHRGSERRPGARGFTDVRVRAQEEAGHRGQVSAVVKASPALKAAIRAEAREAAVDVWNEAVLVCARRAPRASASVGNAGADAGLAM
jgi:hypothetical protein